VAMRRFRPNVLGLWLAACTALAALPQPAVADDAADSRAHALEAAREAARAAMVKGPSTVALKDEAQLALPEGYGYVPPKEAAEFMRLMGNPSDSRFLGLVVPLGGDGHWMIWVQYESSGFVKDDDAKHWDAEELLKSLKEGTEAGNAQRAELGLPELVVTRWIEPPAYAAPTHRLVWSAEAKLKNGTDADPTVNYNTYVLGRDGYVSMNLLTQASTVDSDKLAARRLLGQVTYNSGKDYGDFKPSTDKVAAYGLGALVAGVAAKKLGLLALFAATVVKFAKVIMLAVAGVGAVIAKWFKGRGKDPAEPTA
jgi:uncharacterized membrane-anchored protein